MTSLAVLARNGTYAAVGTVVYSVCQFLILVAFARYGELMMLGQYALALAITAPVFMFSNMRLRFVIATDIDNRHAFGTYFSVRAASSVLAGLALVAVIAVIMGTWEMIVLIACMSLVRIFESFSDLVYGSYQKAHRLEYMAVSLCLAGLGMTAVVVIALQSGSSLITILLAMVVVRVAVFLAYDFVWRNRLPTHDIDAASMETSFFDAMKSIVVKCWPLGLVALLVSLNTNVPRYFIEYLLGSEQLGLFAALAYVPVAGYLIVGTVGQTLMPKIASSYSDGDLAGVRASAAQLCGFGGAAGVLAIAFGFLLGEEFLLLAYGRPFAEQADLFVLLLASGAVSYVVVGAVYVLTATGRYAQQLSIYISDLIVVAGMCLLLVPGLGLGGAGIAMLTSQIVQLAIALVLVALLLQRGRALA